MNDAPRQPFPQQMTPEEARSRRARNVAIGVAVAFFVALFYAVTIVKLGPAVMQRPM